MKLTECYSDKVIKYFDVTTSSTGCHVCPMEYNVERARPISIPISIQETCVITDDNTSFRNVWRTFAKTVFAHNSFLVTICMLPNLFNETTCSSENTGKNQLLNFSNIKILGFHALYLLREVS